MADSPMATQQSGFTPHGHAAWARALVKTGTEHLDLSMVRRGRQHLADATKTHGELGLMIRHAEMSKMMTPGEKESRIARYNALRNKAAEAIFNATNR